ncbi:MAG: DoxX family protein [Flavobacteriales bacterium]
MNIAFHVLKILFGLVFILSGYLKLYPIEPFEFSFVESGFSGWKLAPFFARFLIGLEFLIGAFFILQMRIPRYLFWLTVAVLVFFMVYLVVQITVYGNAGNCGCFGSAIEMTPLQAIFKNGILLGILVFLYWYKPGNFRNKLYTYLLGLVAATSFAMPFILNPVDLSYSGTYLKESAINERIDLNLLYDNATLNTPPRTLSKGKHIIAFLSLTCKHCRMATNKMRIIQERQPSVPFYFVLNGKMEKLEQFYALTRSRKIPHCMLLGKPFIMLAGLDLPTIYLINNGVVEHSIDYFSMNEEGLLNWYNKK